MLYINSYTYLTLGDPRFCFTFCSKNRNQQNFAIWVCVITFKPTKKLHFIRVRLYNNQICWILWCSKFHIDSNDEWWWYLSNLSLISDSPRKQNAGFSSWKKHINTEVFWILKKRKVGYRFGFKRIKTAFQPNSWNKKINSHHFHNLSIYVAVCKLYIFLTHAEYSYYARFICQGKFNLPYDLNWGKFTLQINAPFIILTTIW